jgi:plastocyanin
MIKIRRFWAISAAVVVGLTGTTTAMARGVREVRLQDRCDQATFDAVVGPGTCAPGVEEPVTFAEFAAFLNPTAFGHPKWRYSTEHIDAKPGEKIRLRSEGGEFHTFTQVAMFGGGCVDQLNIPLGLSTAPECAVIDATGVPAWLSTGVAAGGSRDVIAPSKPGSYKFQCMIHPWMRLTLNVRP